MATFVWCVRCGSVSERAELRPHGARQARLAGLARKGCDVSDEPGLFLARPAFPARLAFIYPMSVIRFEELECWQKAKALAVTLYQISKDGKFGRDFGLRDQIRRAAVSIASNIAEGKERETVSEFIRYLYMAKGSAGEVMTQVIIAEEVGYLDREKSIELRQSVQQLSAMIGALIKTLKRRR